VNPAIGFLLVKSQNPRNILLTSAALKPFESLESELMTQFPLKFSNSHVIDSKVQVNIDSLRAKIIWNNSSA